MQVKTGMMMDSGAEVQSLNEIENYLVNFNKEISGDDSDHRFMLTSPASSHIENSGSLYSDAGHVFQVSSSIDSHLKTEQCSLSTSNSLTNVTPASCFDLDTAGDGLAPHLLALQGAPVGIATRVITADDNPADSDDMQTTNTEDISNPTASGSQNTGSFPTVTIVPSELNQGGEVSYVLIVSQQNGKETDGDADLSVYDFKEEKSIVDPDAFNDEDEEEEERPQRRGRRSVAVCLSFELSKFM